MSKRIQFICSLLLLIHLFGVSGATLSAEIGKGIILFEDKYDPAISSLAFPPINYQKRAIEADPNKTIKNYKRLVELISKLPELEPQSIKGLDPLVINNVKSEAKRRLADLMLEYDDDLPFSDPSTTKKNKSGKSAKSFYTTTAEIYELMLLNNPNYSSNDRVLYQLAHIYELMGETEKMMRALDKLVELYPYSPLYAEVEFRRAEYLFVTKDYTAAENAYQAVLIKGEDSPFYNQALYMYGWSQFKLQQIQPAIDSFIQLLDRMMLAIGDVAAVQQNEATKALFRDTIRIIAFGFAHSGGHKTVTDYFAKNGRKAYEHLIYQNLGDHYLRQERFRDSAESYLAFVKLDPANGNAPALQIRAIEIYLDGSFPSLAIKEKKALINRYHFSKSFWQNLDQKGQALIKPHLRSNLVDLAGHYHALAQQQLKKSSAGKKRSDTEFSEATRWYRMLISSFPNDPEIGHFRFLLGELLFDFKQYEQAIVEYTKSSYDTSAHKESAEAGYAAILSYLEEEKKRHGKELKSWQHRRMESALRFSKRYPDDPRRATVLTQTAEQHFEFAEYPKAKEIARLVLQAKPTASPKFQLTARKILAHSAFDQQLYGEAESAYTELLQHVPKKDDRRKEYVERLAAAIYKQGEKHSAAGEHRSAANQFLRVAQLTPGATIVATANFDAATSLLNAEAWTEAAEILETFIKKHPKSPQLNDIYKKLVLAYQKANAPLKTAATLALVAEKDASPEVRREALWQAAGLYRESGNNDKTIKTLQRYIKRHPKPLEQAVEARQQLADIYHQDNKIKQRNRWLKEIIAIDKKAGRSQTERTHYLAAKASFLLADPLFDSFNKVRLKVPLKKTLRSKKRKMQAAIKAYGDVAAYQVAEFTTAATFRTAEIYQLLGKALMESERPKKLSADELEMYEILLEEQAFPFEEKAIEVHEGNVTVVSDGIYNQWVKKSFTALAKLRPVQYDKQEKSEVIFHGLH